MKQLSVLFVVCVAVLMGCSAEVTVTESGTGTGDDGNHAFDPQISLGILPNVVQLTVTNGDPIAPVMTPSAQNVQLGTQDALFLEFTLEAKSDLLTVEHATIKLESPVGGLLVDASGLPYFSSVRLAVGDPAKVLDPIVTITPAALNLDFEVGIRVVPGSPLVAKLYLDVANPAPPEDTALTYKGYTAALVPIEEGDVSDYGPAPWSHPLPAATILPIEQIKQDAVKSEPQTPVPAP